MEEERRYFVPDENANYRFIPYIIDHVYLYPNVQRVHNTQPEQLTQEEIEERYQALADLNKLWIRSQCESNQRISTVEDLYI
jgi:hypothetical protein